MEFHPNDWLGRWQNFESYITSTDPYLQLAWQEAEAAAAALPMFKSGAKQFWQMACVTTSIGNPHTLGGWTITPADGGKLCIAWTDADGNTLGRAVYHLDHVLERGLEGKENALFVAEDVPADWPFRCLLAMEPMPPCAALCGTLRCATATARCWSSATSSALCTACLCGRNCRSCERKRKKRDARKKRHPVSFFYCSVGAGHARPGCVRNTSAFR